MEVRDAKLGKFIQGMNNNEAHIYLMNQLVDIRERHEKEREEDRWVDVNNGNNNKRMLVKVVVADTHDGVIGIREDTKILREVQKGILFMIKYKIFWVIGILVLALFAALGLNVSMDIIKNHIK